MKNCYKFLYLIGLDRKSLANYIRKQIASRIYNTKHSTNIKNLIQDHHYSEATSYIENNRLTNNIEYQRYYAFCLQATGNELATSIMCQYLKGKFSVDVELLKEYLASKLDCDKKCIQYLYQGGMGNFGNFLIKDLEGKNARIAKIINASQYSNEEMFYTRIIDLFNSDHFFIPQFYGSYLYKQKVKVLLTEYVEPKLVDSSCDCYVIEAVRSMKVIRFSSANFPIDKKHLYSGNSEIGNLHHPLTLKMMLERQIGILSRTQGSEELQAKLVDLYSNILTKRIFKLLDPDIHYSFCHNDFHRKNMFMTEDGSIKVFDWNNYRFGLNGWDLAYYWGNFERTLFEIDDLYMSREYLSYNDEELGNTWKVFFLICLIYVWIARLHGNSVSVYMSDYFMPAISRAHMTINCLMENKGVDK